MAGNDILQQVADLLAERIGPDRLDAPIDRRTGLQSELGLKSIEIVGLLAAIESSLGLTTPAAEIPVTELRTVGDLVDRIPGQVRMPATADPLLDSMQRGARRRRGR